MIEIGWQGWVAFNTLVVFLLLLDLGVFNREAKKVTVRAALYWTAFWIALSMAFNGWIFDNFGNQAGLDFFTGYILEKSLSVDNLFVFLLIFNYFRVPAHLQHRVLFLGVLGALVLRGVAIFLGAALVAKFHWVLYGFGVFLIYSGVKLFFFSDDGDESPENAIVKAVRRRVKMTDEFHDEKFFVVKEGVRYATPLFLVLVAVETSDVLFAVDSIPAIFGVTHDPFIVYTSNVMAILGLRSLYFALAGLLEYFHYLNAGLSLVLIFIGVKMLGEGFWEVSDAAELGVIGVILLGSVLASVFFPKKVSVELSDTPTDESEKNAG